MLGLTVVFTASWVRLSTLKAIASAQEELMSNTGVLQNGRTFKEWVAQHLSTMHELKDMSEESEHARLNPNRSELELKVGDRVYPFVIECEWRSSSMGAYSALSGERHQRPLTGLPGRPSPWFMILGIGGIPDEPESLFIIPADQLPTGRISMDYLERFRQPMTGAQFHFDPFARKLSFWRPEEG